MKRLGRRRRVRPETAMLRCHRIRWSGGTCTRGRRRHDRKQAGRTTVKVLGINAVFHDPAAALVIDGETVAAAEEERFTRRKHGKTPVAFSTWELPEQSMQWCLDQAGVAPGELDAIAYSYDPGLGARVGDDLTRDDWE